MSLRDLTDRTAVFKAMEEYDGIGAAAFLRKYGFGEAKSYFLEHEGKRYDSKAIVGAAHAYQTGTPLNARHFSGGVATVLKKLMSLGFSVTSREDNAGKPWSDEEVKHTVSDYFEMLRLELRGRRPNKTEHRINLLPHLNKRSDAAVELKHQNISAILDELGLPFIRGYKPRHNYQHSLALAVDGFLADHPDFFTALAPESEPSAASPTQLPLTKELIRVDAPAHRTAVDTRAPRAFKPRQRDFAQIDAQCRELGKVGEELVVSFEKQRLTKLGRGDLAAKVEWVSRTQGDGAGNDIASFQENGEPLFIEVKTTNCGKDFPFILTDREVEFARRKSANYCLYRIFDCAKVAKFFTIPAPLEKNLTLKPKTFEASF
jgi:hypothetical protein